MNSKDPQTKALAECIGKKVRTLRNSRGLTQKELAGNSISRNMLSMIESGAALPSLETLMHISDVLSVSTGYFFAEGEEEMMYGKREAVQNARHLMDEKRYADAAEVCIPFAESDGEMLLYLVMCHLNCGLEFLDRYWLASAEVYFEAAAKAADKLTFGGEYIIGICDFIKTLVKSVKSDTVPYTLSDFEKLQKTVVPASFTAYISAYKSLKEGDTECAAAIARSGLLGRFHSLHIRGSVLMATGDNDGATRLFDLALSSDDGGFYSRYKLICDLELCRKNAGDFESAYALSTSRMEMLGMFSR